MAENRAASAIVVKSEAVGDSFVKVGRDGQSGCYLQRPQSTTLRRGAGM
jgi:hypothetical protein